MKQSVPQRPFRFGVVSSSADTAEAWLERIRDIESLGYSSVLTTDHLDDQLAPGPALAAAATATTTLRIGTMVYGNDFRHPLVAAKEIATLDVLSAGRMEAGLGAGWDGAEYARAGLAFDPASIRISRMEEAVEIIRLALRGETFSYTGKHYQITDYQPLPVSVQRPGPPLLVGGGGRRVLELAGRSADIVSLNPRLSHGTAAPDSTLGSDGTAAQTDVKIGWLAAGAGSRLDEIEIAITIYAMLHSAPDSQAARKLAVAIGVSLADLLEMPYALVGSPEQMADTLLRRRDRWGISYIAINWRQRHAFAPVLEALAGR
jgi:probable F420-dependent oxidoreductase